ncbi:hypothetical protein CORC01_12832 [Colletotrichum orchidophilum]|uniref:Uncharacterized protein n=1 Tax=Colletotrichum orchidophilum TaxID=1209926 RepID=A0A1G4ARU2_9PEZI|nr:uncharacterized protein CORC01_12832 [Colletotrichum orchidophilum]OHE91879.1 hypothetical protein CORC01_12832 [Colletotrichum orchidophilum]
MEPMEEEEEEKKEQEQEGEEDGGWMTWEEESKTNHSQKPRLQPMIRVKVPFARVEPNKKHARVPIRHLHTSKCLFRRLSAGLHELPYA